MEQVKSIAFRRAWFPSEYSAQRPFVESCKFCKDNRWLIFTGSDGNLRYFDIQQDKVIETQLSNGIIWSVDCSENGELVCICDSERLVTVWERGSMQCVASHSHHTDTVWRVKFTKDNNHVISCSSDLRIIVWNFWDDTVKEMAGHVKIVEDISISRNGLTLASCSHDRTVRIWNLTLNDTQKQQKCTVLKGHEKRVTSCVFAPHRDETVASASADCTIIIWDVFKRRPLIRLRGHFNIIWSCAFLKLKGTEYLISCSSDHSVR